MTIKKSTLIIGTSVLATLMTTAIISTASSISELSTTQKLILYRLDKIEEQFTPLNSDVAFLKQRQLELDNQLIKLELYLLQHTYDNEGLKLVLSHRLDEAKLVDLGILRRVKPVNPLEKKED